MNRRDAKEELGLKSRVSHGQCFVVVPKLLLLILIFGDTLAGSVDLSIAGLSIGQKFDVTQLRTILRNATCTNDRYCQGYLEIGFPAYTVVEGKDRKISSVVMTLYGSQYSFVHKYLTEKYGEPTKRPNKILKKGINNILESKIVEWHGRDQTVLRLSEDERPQVVTLILSVSSR